MKISETIFNDLKSTAKSQQRLQSLENIKKVCDILDDARASITPASVGRVCQKQYGGPKSQSIRNSPDELLKYIRARSNEQVLPNSEAKKTEMEIEDPRVKAFVSLLQEELYQERAAKKRMIAALRNLYPLDIDELISRGFSNDVKDVKPHSKIELERNARLALEKIVDDTHLLKFGLECYRNSIKSTGPANTIFLSKDEVSAIRRLLNSEESQTIGNN
jgi:hypothetical protein